MKKVLALLMAVLMLASICCAWAEETEDSITWQGIPWESSLDETVEALLVLGVITDAADMLFLGTGSMSTLPLLFDEDGPILAAEYDDEKAYDLEAKQIYAVEPSDYMIAGYNTQVIYFAFAFDGTANKLVSVMVMLECPEKMDEQDMADDLRVKCDQVYGEGSSLYDMPIYSRENTYLLLTPDVSCVLLCYGTGKGWSLIEEASSNLPVEEDDSSASGALDTNGL